jgi:hypothetical protein
MKKFRKLLLGSGIAIALTASFAFKSANQNWTTVSIWDPINTYECDLGLIADGDCVAVDVGPQCTVYYSDTYPNVPAYAADEPTCTYPVYQQNP